MILPCLKSYVVALSVIGDSVKETHVRNIYGVLILELKLCFTGMDRRHRDLIGNYVRIHDQCIEGLWTRVG